MFVFRHSLHFVVKFRCPLTATVPAHLNQAVQACPERPHCRFINLKGLKGEVRPQAHALTQSAVKDDVFIQDDKLACEAYAWPGVLQACRFVITVGKQG